MLSSVPKMVASVSISSKEPEDDEPRDDEDELVRYWQLPRAFTEKRHTEKIEAFETATQTWRMKERMKTVSVALVMCLNVGVDPPDVVKISPCARLECWVDPFMYIDPCSSTNQKAVEIVGASLQHQYERWQPRARYKLSLDPTVEDVRKLCISLRRNAKDERVLFHYNGHGVPRPTSNGEIWVFNKQFTQYIPLAICDLHMWMTYPSIYVFDCSSAGSIVDYVKKHMSSLITAREQLDVQVPDMMNISDGVPDVMTNSDTVSTSNDCIQLAACQANELLPMNPELPADLFTSCLTTPIKIALRWFVLQNSSKLVPGITVDLVDKVQGLLNDRRTMLGELNWIFTAITDTIAWNVLSRDLFQKLFRQDLLVASLFRNFLLAERIMRSYNCNPVSSPRLPPTFQHPMWQAWDLALDHCLAQLPQLLEENCPFEHSPFFAEQLTAFQVWLEYGTEKRSPPEQLPIVLQVLLSQVHRQRALELLGRFLDLGPWAVNLALSVGIFPYVLKLLQSSARELRPLLVFIWAKLLAVDSVRKDLSSCQTDLIKDNGHKYFLSILADQYMPPEHRTMAAFILTMIVHNNPSGQEAAVQGNIIALCLEQLVDPYPLLRQWLALCLGKVWTKYDAARWCGVRDIAHEKLFPLLTDEFPEVRAAVVFALGTFVNNSAERGEHANSIDHGVATKLLMVLHDGSPLVRKELVVALSGFVSQFETQFASIAFQHSEAEKEREYHTVTGTVGVWNSPNEAAFMAGGGMRRSVSSRCLTGMLSPLTAAVGIDAFDQQSGTVKRIASTSSMLGTVLSSYSGIYSNVWKTLLSLAGDPSPPVSDMAKKLILYIRQRASTAAQPRPLIQQQRKSSVPISAPSSPNSRTGAFMAKQSGEQKSESPEASRPMTLRIDLPTTPLRTSVCSTNDPSIPLYLRARKSLVPESINERDEETSGALQTTEFFEWCCKYFTEPMMTSSPENDPHGVARYEHEYRFQRAAHAHRSSVSDHNRANSSRLDELIFINRNLGVPNVLRFHPYEPHLAVADKDHISIWDWEQGSRLSMFSVRNPRHTRITHAEFINAHDQAYILAGSDDGSVKIWRNYYSESGIATPDMVTAWQALTDMLPIAKGSGMVVHWEQSSGLLYTSGDVRVIRIWDTQKELRVQDIPTNADSCITSLSLGTSSNNLIVAGCGDGTVRVIDKRMPPNDCIIQIFHEHQNWVVKAYTLQNYPNRVVSASVNGDVRLWDIRGKDSLKVINTSPGLTAIDAHQYAGIIACGSVQQYIGVYNHGGETLSTIKYHEGFMGQRIGPVTCLAFHPLKAKLVVGSEDQFVSIYSMPNSKKR